MSIYTCPPKIKVTHIASHRNGIGGAPFHVVLFEVLGGTQVGIVFDEPDHCAVLNVQKLAQGDIKFGSNSYRGDMYEPLLRKAISEHEEAIRNSIDPNS
jgi:hypothetical protein